MNFIKNKTKAIIAFGVVTLLGATTVATVPAFAETLNEAFPQPTFSANKNALTAPVGELHTIKTSNVALGKILQFMYANYLTEEEKTELQTFVDTCQNETNIEKSKDSKNLFNLVKSIDDIDLESLKLKDVYSIFKKLKKEANEILKKP